MEQELNWMEQLGVIFRVNTPVMWYMGMVVMPKKSGVRGSENLHGPQATKQTHPEEAFHNSEGE